MTSLTASESRRVAQAFAEADKPQHQFEYVPKPGPPTPLRTFVSSDHVLTVAVSPIGNQQLTLEREGRSWAASHGIPVPQVLAAGSADRWMLARLVTTSDSEGSRYVLNGLTAADRIMAAPTPRLTIPPTQWRGDRRTLVTRLARLAAGGLSLTRLRTARRRYQQLTDRATAHGDYYRRNVLACADSDAVSVVDWEFIGSAPRWTDHLRFWSTLRRTDDREQAWDVITSPLDGRQREHVAAVGRYLVLRLLGENLAAPPSQRDELDLAHARDMVRAWPTYEARLAAP